MPEIDVPMPKLSMTMEEGELIAWVKHEGDQVRAGEVICEVNSDKVEMEVESPADGTLVRLAAAEELAGAGIEATVVDPRTLKPLDEATILERVRATGRALLVQEAPRTAGFMAEIAARISESDTLYYLQAPIRRLSGLDAPIPYNPDLEKASVPQVPDIVRAARELAEAG